MQCLTSFLLLSAYCASGQQMSSVPGPPYPDDHGENRWGVKFDPRLHGPAFDKTSNSFQPQSQVQQKSQAYQPQFQQYNHNQPPHQQQPQTAAYPQKNFNINNQQSYGQQSPRNSYYSTLPQSVLNQPGANQPLNSGMNNSPPNQYNAIYNKAKEFYNKWNANYNTHQGGNNNQNKNNNEIGSAASNFKAVAKIEHPSVHSYRKPIHYTKYYKYSHHVKHHKHHQHKRYPSLFHSLLKASLSPNHGWKPHKTQVFTTLGKGLDVLSGGASTATRAIKQTTGNVLATGVTLGGKAAYIGSRVIAKVIKKASRW